MHPKIVPFAIQFSNECSLSLSLSLMSLLSNSEPLSWQSLTHHCALVNYLLLLDQIKVRGIAFDIHADSCFKQSSFLIHLLSAVWGQDRVSSVLIFLVDFLCIASKQFLAEFIGPIAMQWLCGFGLTRTEVQRFDHLDLAHITFCLLGEKNSGSHSPPLCLPVWSFIKSTKQCSNRHSDSEPIWNV